MNIGIQYPKSIHHADSLNLVQTNSKTSKRLTRRCLGLKGNYQANFSNSLCAFDSQSVFVLSMQTRPPDSTTKDNETTIQLCNAASIPTINYNDPDDNDSYLSETESVIFKYATSESSSLQINSCLKDNQDNSSIASNTILPGNLYMPNENVLYNCMNSKGFKAYARIYDILYKARVPSYCYDKIIKAVSNDV
jgi:hypothetical protein